MGKKVLMLIGDACEDMEVLMPLQVLEMFGHTVHLVSPGKSVSEKV